MRYLSNLLSISACAWLVSGCASWSQLEPRSLPEVESPEQWQAEFVQLEATSYSWLTRLEEPRLEKLVVEALGNNPELQRIRALLAEGEAQAVIAGAEGAPRLDASVQGGRSDRGSGASDEFSANLSFGWELDLWNKLSDSARAAELDRQALFQDYRSARLSLAANLTKSWFSAVEAKLQLRLSQRLVEVLTKRLEVLEEGYRSGLVAALDIHLARANLAAERARRSTREQTLSNRTRSLELLLGRYPGNQVALVEQLPELPESIPTGLPSELLTRRSDIRAAQLRIEGSWARLARSHKDRFPSFRLTATAGSSSDELDRLLRSDSLVWSLLAGVTQPLLDGGRLETLEALSLARAQQREAQYRDTVLQAFSEVEQGLELEQLLKQSVTALQISSDESDQAELLAAEQYRSGLVDFITLLEAQQRAFDARSNYIQVRNQQLQNRIDLYLALGGDFIVSGS